MRPGESIGFSSNLCTFFVEQDRLFTSYLRAEGLITYNELTALGALVEVDKPLAAEPLADFLMLSPRTVRALFLDMEEKGLVTKQSQPDDGRFMLVELTEVGNAVTERSLSDLFFLLVDAYWESLPESDFNDVLKVDIRHDVNVLRGKVVEPFGDIVQIGRFIPPDFFVFWRIVYDRWAECVRKESRRALTLGDLRVLHYVNECGPIGLSAVADALVMQRSALSLSKKRLMEQELLVEKRNEVDGRRVEVACTSQGRRTAQRFVRKLDRITREVHAGLTMEHATVVEAWYARMISNMKRRIC